jgi:IS605 OrfB family transposase
MKTTIQTQLLEIDSQVAAELDHLMRAFQSCRRAAFNRQLGDMPLSELRRHLAGRFPELDARYRNDAILQAQAIIDSQRELLPRRLAEVEAKIRRTERKLTRVSDSLRRERIVARLDKLRRKREELVGHLERGTIPKVVFGGRRNLKLRHQGRLSREEWQRLRAQSFYSRGEKNKQGNLHTRLRYDADLERFYLRVGFPQEGNRCRYEWFRIQVPNKELYRDLLLAASRGQEAYSIEVRRHNEGYSAHITVEEKTPGRVTRAIEAERIAAADLNLDRVAVAVSDGEGQYRGSKVYDCSALAHAGRGKRDWLIGNLAREMIGDLVAQEIGALVLEKLDIKQTHDTNARYNRQTVNFTYRRLHDGLVREALRAGLQVKLVNPAYSSVMGRLKYAGPYGISDHQAAAYVLARRGIRLREGLPKPLVKALPVLVGTLDTLMPSLAGHKLERAQKWRERLANWHHYSPQESKHPWLLWATIESVCKLTKRQLTWSSGGLVVAGMVGVTGG